MKKEVFQNILDHIDRDKAAELIFRDNDKEYIRRFIPNERLILLGGGHVSLALCRMAQMIGFSVTVVDDRPEFAYPSRFPWADEVICGDFISTIASLKIKETDFVCILTRGHRWDQECVEAVLSGTMPQYLGMIGSKRRVAGLKEYLHETGYDQDRIDQLHAPIGLPIGGQTPAEIAVSICAEMISCRHHQLNYTDRALSATNTDRDLLEFIIGSDVPCAVAVVISVSGSAPVSDGAIMGVDAEGQISGTVGGGCGEAAAIAKASRVIANGTSCVLDLDMSNEVAADNGLVCGGMMRILIEPVFD